MKIRTTRRGPSKQPPPPTFDPAFAAVVDAFAKDSRVTQGRLMASYGLKVNGKIFAMLVRGRFVTKLPKSKVDELVTAGIGQRFDPGHGRLMKEWIVLGKGKADWVALASEARAFVGHLRDKA